MTWSKLRIEGRCLLGTVLRRVVVAHFGCLRNRALFEHLFSTSLVSALLVDAVLFTIEACVMAAICGRLASRVNFPHLDD